MYFHGFTFGLTSKYFIFDHPICHWVRCTALKQVVGCNCLVMWLQDRFHEYSYLKKIRVCCSVFHKSKCILNMLQTKPGVVPLYSIVIYLNKKLHVFNSTCNLHTDIEDKVSSYSQIAFFKGDSYKHDQLKLRKYINIQI